MKNIEWKKVEGYESYEVSNTGLVRSVDREIKRTDGQIRFVEGKDLTIQYDSRSGRPMVRLYHAETRKGRTFKVHRLVALMFIGERPEGTETCHLDGDVTNNNIENLQYKSKSSNQIDIMKHSGKCAAGKLSVEQVVEIRRAYKEKEMNQYELAEVFEIAQGTVSSIINGRSFSWLNDDGTINDTIA
ncbi:NUMOD4 domain-containing protein [Staphylococcus shinii]|uniref:NUMOD4 domain-containing protein n=1 Tax=Staphylococcus shinii TaxID=2912228 RepID=UPI003F84053A